MSFLLYSIFSTPGRLLYDQLGSDSEAGFRRDTSTMTLDQVVALNQVKRSVETLERRLDKLQDFWQERDRELSQTVQYSDLEGAMKTVCVCVRVPAQVGRVSGLPVALYSLYCPIFLGLPYITLYCCQFALYALYFQQFLQINWLMIRKSQNPDAPMGLLTHKL